MADFEGLIRQALKTQDSNNPAIRQKIYHSSRVALKRMLEKAGNQPVEAVKSHFQGLENSISRIEADYTAAISAEPAAEPLAAPTPPPTELPVQQTSPHQASNLHPSLLSPQPTEAHLQQAPVAQRPIPNVSNLPIYQDGRRDFEPEGEAYNKMDSRAEPFLGDVMLEGSSRGIERTVPGQQDRLDVSPELKPELPAQLDETRIYKRRNPFLRRIWSVLLIVAVLLVIFWLLYALAINVAGISPETKTSQSGTALNEQVQANDPASEYITVLEPSDPSALITSGRGSADVISASNTQMLRIRSIRQGQSANQLADPILLELQPGVLRKIAGKSVTVEMRVKSGGGGPAQFSIECDIAGASQCGRKRFRVGLQTEDIVFALDIDKSTVNGNAFLAINTDVTSSADATGLGDLIDIVYTRIRVPN